MEEKSLIEQLDHVLKYFHDNSHHVISASDYYRYTGNINESKTFLRKLIDDGYVKDRNRIYAISVEGIVFYETGGYKQEIQNKITSDRDAYIRTLILTYGTGLAGLYGLVEIVKWLTPAFQFVCHCQFVWQK